MSDTILNLRHRLFNNIIKGKIGEQIAKLDYIDNGYSIQNTGRGSDFVAIKRLNDSSLIYEFVEVKTGKARTSKKQQTVMRQVKKSGKFYTIYRINDVFINTHLHSISNESGESTI